MAEADISVHIKTFGIRPPMTESPRHLSKHSTLYGLRAVKVEETCDSTHRGITQKYEQCSREQLYSADVLLEKSLQDFFFTFPAQGMFCNIDIRIQYFSIFYVISKFT